MIVIDIETTGLDPRRCGLLSIGAVDFNKPKSFFYGECRLSGKVLLDEESLKVNGFSREGLYDTTKLTSRDLMHKFVHWLSEKDNTTIAGHNVHWDVNFLSLNFKKYKINYDLGYRFVDLHSIFYAKLLKLGKTIPLRDSKSSISLNYILGFCGLSVYRTHHNALEDALLTAECLSRIISGKVLIEKYSCYPLPFYLADVI